MLLLLLVQNVNLEWMIVVEGDFAASEFLGDFDVGDAVVVWNVEFGLDRGLSGVRCSDRFF